MSKALVGLIALGGLGALAFAASKASAAGNGAPAGGALVTGASGTTYGLAKIATENSDNGTVETWEVSDAAGPMLQYVQFQGDDHTRQLKALAQGRNLGDIIVNHAITDFGILVA